MPIHRAPSGFWESEDIDGVPSLGIESSKLLECIRYCQEKRFKRIFGSPYFGFRETDLNFLSQMRQATRIWFWDIKLNNVDAIYELKSLEQFGIHPRRPGIDFSRFQKLETATVYWTKKDNLLANSSLKTLYLCHFNPKSKSFAESAVPRQVRTLHFTWSNPTTLEGLPVFPDLKHLQIHRNRMLHDISLLPLIAPNLTSLCIENCPRLKKIAGIADLPKLKIALVSGKILIDRSESSARS